MTNIRKADAENMRLKISPSGINVPDEVPVRYQSKYFQLSFKPDIMHQDLIAFFSPKGLVSIAVFQCDNELRVFLAFDKPKDFSLCKYTNLIVNPKYFENIFDGAIVRGSDSFENDIDYFKKILSENDDYTCLLGNENDFMFNLTIKDITYFDKILSKQVLDKLKESELKKYQEQLYEYGLKLKGDINYYNDLLKRITKETEYFQINKVTMPSIQNLEEPIQNSTINGRSSKTDQLNLPIYTDSDTKPFRETEKLKFFALIDDGIVNKDILNYILTFPFETSKHLIKLYKEEKRVNVSRSKNDLFRITAMYYEEKSMPKTSDPNTWLKRLKNELPDILLNFYKKYF